MLISYQSRELHRAGRAPFILWLQGNASLVAPSGNALSCANPFAVGCDLLARLCKDYPKPEFGLTETIIGGKPVAVRETVVLARSFCRLLHFERAMTRTHPIALIVAPLSGHHATLVDVQDHGIGLADCDSIFEPFVTTKETGMGMGLTSCQSIIAAHGGRIWVVRNEAQGVTFSFSLPIDMSEVR